MNLERIAEIEATCSLVGECSHWPRTLAELCRLARLGLRVEGAPTTKGSAPSMMIGGKNPGMWSWVSSEVPAHFAGKRVALVVLEDAK